MPTSQVVLELLDGPLDCEGFSLHGSVVSLGGAQFSAKVNDQVLLSFKGQGTNGV